MTENKKSYGFGFFNPDDRLKQIINDIASEKDLKSLRCTFLLLLEHPLVKPRLLERYGEQAFKEIFEKYNVTTKTEAEREKKKKDNQKKVKIEALKILGFSSEDAEKLSELPSEELKTLAYLKQNAKDRIEDQKEQKLELDREEQKRKELQPDIERLEKWLANPPQTTTPQIIEDVRKKLAELKAKQTSKAERGEQT